MQTTLLSKQVSSSLVELKLAIEKFEKYSSPISQQTQELHHAINQANKIISAYMVLSELQEIKPQTISVAEVVTPVLEVKEEVKIVPAEPKIVQVKEEPIIISIPKEDVVFQNKTEEVKNLPKLSININDKFRFINELFSGNVEEYNMAIDHLNTLQNIEESKIYFNGLKDIYQWKEENELRKTLNSLIEKRYI